MRTKDDITQRIKVTVTRRLIRSLRSVLALRGLSVSAWFRKLAEAEVEKKR